MATTLYRILFDTCIWLDMAKSYKSAPLVYALRELIDNAELEIIVPDLVREEFDRNKARVAGEAAQSLSSVVRQIKHAVNTFSDKETSERVLSSLAEVDFNVNSAAARSGIVDQVEELMNHHENIRIETTIDMKIAAADRALSKIAPCHRDKNSIADAIIFEAYDTERKKPHRGHIQYGFATLNIRDFSTENGDFRTPHSDISSAFGDDSIYLVDVLKFVQSHNTDLLAEADLVIGDSSYFKTLNDILAAAGELQDAVWYTRHLHFRNQIETGKHKILPTKEYDALKVKKGFTPEEIWHGALAAADQVKARLGEDNLGPWDDFHWGMINGKLSALRWMLGEDWDMLDT